MGLYVQDHSLMPENTGNLGRLLLAETNVYRLIGDQLSELVRDDDFADIYDELGGPALSPSMLGLVTVFQMLEKLPDRQASEAVVLRIDWKYALHLPLEYKGFAYTNLSHFRARLLANQAEYRIFDQLLKKLVELGFVRHKGKQRTDSTHVLGLVAKLSRLELVRETLRVALHAMQEHSANWVQAHVPATFQENYLARVTDYQLSETEVARRLEQIGADGWWLLQQLTPLPEVFAGLQEIETLRQVWQQQYTVDENGSYKGPRQKLNGADLIQSPHDVEARYSEKRGKGWQGYRSQLTETAEAKGSPNFIVDVAVTSAQLQDVSALPAIQARLAGRDLLPSEQIVDQGYVSSGQIAAGQAKGLRLHGPMPMMPKTPFFPLEAFQLNLEQRVAICPGGKSSEKGLYEPHQNAPNEYLFFFGQQCQSCPIRSQCTNARDGRTLSYNVNHVYMQERYAEMKTADFWLEMKLRPPVEGTISQAVRLGARRARYRGQRRVNLQWVFTAIAINVRRLAKVLGRMTVHHFLSQFVKNYTYTESFIAVPACRELKLALRVAHSRGVFGLG
jgi:transposase